MTRPLSVTSNHTSMLFTLPFIVKADDRSTTRFLSVEVTSAEDANFFVNNLKLNILLQGTEYKDKSGYPLYNKGCQVIGEIACGWSGVREIEWGTSVGEGGKVTVDANGAVSGSSGYNNPIPTIGICFSTWRTARDFSWLGCYIFWNVGSYHRVIYCYCCRLDTLVVIFSPIS